MNLAEFKGKPTVGSLWATWCPPCVLEMPMLHQAQIDRPGVNFGVLNQGEPADKPGAWLQARNLRKAGLSQFRIERARQHSLVKVEAEARAVEHADGAAARIRSQW